MIMKQGGMSPTTTCNKSVSFRLTKSASSSRLKGVEESDSFPLKNMEDPDLPVSTSYCALPGMSNYSASESEEEVDEKILRFPFSNIHNEETVGHNYSATPKVHTGKYHNSPTSQYYFLVQLATDITGFHVCIIVALFGSHFPTKSMST